VRSRPGIGPKTHDANNVTVPARPSDLRLLHLRATILGFSGGRAGRDATDDVELLPRSRWIRFADRFLLATLLDVSFHSGVRNQNGAKAGRPVGLKRTGYYNAIATRSFYRFLLNWAAQPT
jgi:hypothetical protein